MLPGTNMPSSGLNWIFRLPQVAVSFLLMLAPCLLKKTPLFHFSSSRWQHWLTEVNVERLAQSIWLCTILSFNNQLNEDP